MAASIVGLALRLVNVVNHSKDKIAGHSHNFRVGDDNSHGNVERRPSAASPVRFGQAFVMSSRGGHGGPPLQFNLNTTASQSSLEPGLLTAALELGALLNQAYELSAIALGVITPRLSRQRQAVLE